MKFAIDQIIEIDKEARLIVSRAAEKHERIMEDSGTLREAIIVECEAASKKALDASRRSAMAKADEEIAKIQANEHTRISAIERAMAAGGKEWADEITKRILTGFDYE